MAVAAVEQDPASIAGQDGRCILAPQAALRVSIGAITSFKIAAVAACLVVWSMASRAATAAVFVRAHDVVVRDVVQGSNYVAGVSRGGGATARPRSYVALLADRLASTIGVTVVGRTADAVRDRHHLRRR